LFSPSQNPFCILKCRKGFSLQKTKGRSSASRFLRRRRSRRRKRAPTIAFASRKKSLTLPHKFLKHNKSAPSAKSARENANRLQKF